MSKSYSLNKIDKNKVRNSNSGSANCILLLPCQTALPQSDPECALPALHSPRPLQCLTWMHSPANAKQTTITDE